jgi:predicted Zn-dependent protease
MPGGKIVVYTGILPVAENTAGLATIMGHELAHALLNHGRQDESADFLKFLDALALSLVTQDKSSNTRELTRFAYDAGSTLLATLPFSRAHENEADETGLVLMTLAGYDPNEAVSFWSRMDALNDDASLEFLGTHPSDSKRIENLQRSIPITKANAEQIRATAISK